MTQENDPHRWLNPPATREAWNTLDGWRKVDAKAVASGSQAQSANVLEMALQDLVWAFETLESCGVSIQRRPIDTHLIFRK